MFSLPARNESEPLIGCYLLFHCLYMLILHKDNFSQTWLSLVKSQIIIIMKKRKTNHCSCSGGFQ